MTGDDPQATHGPAGARANDGARPNAASPASRGPSEPPEPPEPRDPPAPRDPPEPSPSIPTPLTRDAGIAVPLIGGAMYPCSNPELVAAVSDAGGIGIVQPLSLTYVHGYGFREGLRFIRRLTDRPIGMNALIEKTSSRYRQRVEEWVDVALEEGVRFFVTSLGNPRWVVERAHAVGGVVYHDATERKWARKAIDAGVDGLIGVNRRAGGHPGPLDAAALLDELGDLGVPVVCAGGIGTADEFAVVLSHGYAGVQMGTRFIATRECTASDAYKAAILRAGEDDIVWSEKITGVPVALIRTPRVERMGLKAGPVARRLLRGRRTKHLVRTFYKLLSVRRFRRSAFAREGVADFWQAGRSVAGIESIRPAGEIVREFAEVARAAGVRSAV